MPWATGGLVSEEAGGLDFSQRFTMKLGSWGDTRQGPDFSSVSWMCSFALGGAWEGQPCDLQQYNRALPGRAHLSLSSDFSGHFLSTLLVPEVARLFFVLFFFKTSSSD